MRKILYMDYYADFECIGGKCPYTCCGGWNIGLKPNEIEKYKTVAEPFRSELMEAINEEKMCMRQRDEKCTLLTEDGWCKLVRECGTGFLSVTCTIFPRITFEYGEICEAMVEIVCPVVGEYLLQPKKIGFGYKEIEDDGFDAIDEELYFTLADIRGKLVDFFQQEDGVNNQTKILVLLKMEEYISNLYKKTGKLNRERLNRYWETYTQKKNMEEISAFGEEVQRKEDQQIKILVQFFQKFIKEKTFAFVAKKLQGKINFDYIIYVWMQDLETFKKDLRDFCFHFRKEYPAFPENFFVYYLFRNWIPKDSTVKMNMDAFGYQMSIEVVEFLLIQICMLCLFKEKGELLPEDYGVVIAGVDRIFSHVKELRELMEKFLESLSFVEILLLLVV